MTKHAKATQSVYAKFVTRQRHIMRPSKHKQPWLCIPRTIPYIAVFIGLFSLTSCQNKEAQKRLEMTIESQAIQMAALNDRLARCEHEWQTNTDEIMRYNEVTMRDIAAFREEQNSLRKSVFGMDERWAIQHNDMRKHQKQIHQSVEKLDENVIKTDTHLANVNVDLKKSIDATRTSLNANLDTFARNTHKQVAHLQTTADSISDEVVAVQTQNHALYTRISDDKENTDQQLKALQTSVDKVQTTTETAVNGINTTNSKNDQILAWSQRHSQRLETIKKENDANRAASDKALITQLDGLKQQTHVQAQRATTRHAEVRDQLNTLEIQNTEIQGQISDVAQEAQTRFGGVTAYQAQLYQAVKKNDQKVGTIHQQLSAEHQHLNNQIKKVDTTTTTIAEQIQKGQQAQTDSTQGLRQQVSNLNRRWSNTFQQRFEAEDAQAEKRQTEVTQKLESLKHQGNALGQKLDQAIYQQKKQAEDAQKERLDLSDKQSKKWDETNQEIRKNRTQLSEEVHQTQIQTQQVSQQIKQSDANRTQSNQDLVERINNLQTVQNQVVQAETTRHESVTNRLQTLVQQHKAFQAHMDHTAQTQQDLLKAATAHRTELAAQAAKRSETIKTTINQTGQKHSQAINKLAQEQLASLKSLEQGQVQLNTWTQNHDALAAKNQVSTLQRYQATSRQLEDLQQQNQEIKTRLVENTQAQKHRDQLAQQTNASMARLEKGQDTLSIWTQHQNDLQSKQQVLGDQRHQAVTATLQKIQHENEGINKVLIQNTEAQAQSHQAMTHQLDQIKQHQTELKASLTQQQKTKEDLDQARLAQLQQTLINGQKELQRDLNNLGAASATVAQGNEKANRLLDQKVSNLLIQNEQTHKRLDNNEIARTDQLKNLEKQVQQVHTAVVQESTKLQTTQKQLGLQATQNQSQNSQQLAALAKNINTQGQNLEKKTSGLASMNQNLLEQLTKVADTQTQFQRAVQKEQSTTHTAIENHSQNLQAQLKQLTQLLNSLESRLDKTSKELEKSIQSGSQADQETSQAMKQELDSLRQTVSLITHTQTVIQQQLTTLQTTVKDQHKTQTDELMEIKEKVSQAKAAETSEEGS